MSEERLSAECDVLVGLMGVARILGVYPYIPVHFQRAISVLHTSCKIAINCSQPLKSLVLSWRGEEMKTAG